MKKILIALFVFALGMMITNDEAFGQSPGTVTVDSVTAQRGDQIAVGVRLEGSSINISGLLAPIRYSNTNLRLDSVSFIGTVITNDFVGVIDTVSDPDIVRISYLLTNYTLPVKYLSSPNGLLATMFFTVKNDALPGNFSIDSVMQIENVGGNIRETNIQFASPDGLTTYHPDFQEGNVAILVPTGINDDLNSALPKDFSLAQNYPNPFNPTTIIGFSLPTASHVKLEVFNVLGQKVETLADGKYSAGNYNMEFNATNHPSGVFFYRLTHDNGVETKKMILIK